MAGAGRGRSRESQADPRAVVEAGNARFTVLTPQLIRMEWSADGRFEDRATLTFVNRRTPVPEFRVRDTKSRLTITTPALTLTYTKGEKFSAANLKAVFRLNGREVVWTPRHGGPAEPHGHDPHARRMRRPETGPRTDGAGPPVARGLVGGR